MEKGVSREQLVSDILEKKELSSLDPEFVNTKLDTFLLKRPDMARKLKEISPRSKSYKTLVSQIRSQLRKVYGVFFTARSGKRDELLDKVENVKDLDSITNLLSVHRSSKERLESYPEVYKEIFKITKKPKSIVDLACGFNPLSYPYLGCKPEYLACDISKQDLEFLQAFFDRFKIKGKTLQIDLLKDNLKEITAGKDITFLFKALDSIETVKRNSSERVLREISSKFIVVSFATMSIGGSNSIKASRKWFELMSQRLGFSFEKLEFPGEVFYILRKA